MSDALSEEAVARMVEVWRDFRSEQVYRADSLGVIRSGAKWLTLFSLGWALARWRRMRPRSLLDNTPMHDTLAKRAGVKRYVLASSCSVYGSGDNQVLTRVSLPVMERDVVCIVGPSGSGKTTLLRCLALLETPSEGRIVMDLEKIKAWLEKGAQPTDRVARFLLASMERFASQTERDVHPHPIFGPLTTWEWQRWGWLHADHHLRQFGV